MNLLDAIAISEVLKVDAAVEQERQGVLGHIREGATSELVHSMLALREEWFPASSVEPEVDVRIELAQPDRDAVDAMPTEEAVFGEVRLGEEWLAGRERTGLVEVDGHFILDYGRPDQHGRALEVHALRLLPTAWSPAVPAPNDPEYASSPATIEWTGETAGLRWVENDPLEAAVRWVARFAEATFDQSQREGCG